MKLLLDYLPIIVFFLVFKFAAEFIQALAPWLSADQLSLLESLDPMILATAVLIPATVLQILAVKLIWGKVEKMHLITLAIVVLVGTLTLLLRDKTFIQWKPTIVNWIFALAFIGYRLFTGRHLLERMISANLTLPDAIWAKLSAAWVVFFIFSGILNLYVAYNYSDDIWVDFKLFGLLALTVVFIIGQGVYLSRYIKEEDVK
ncbi:MAG: septation protein A [Oleibacter sp.]|nr:septation protein A [Thalassolituus sp.]